MRCQLGPAKKVSILLRIPDAKVVRTSVLTKELGGLKTFSLSEMVTDGTRDECQGIAYLSFGRRRDLGHCATCAPPRPTNRLCLFEVPPAHIQCSTRCHYFGPIGTS